MVRQAVSMGLAARSTASGESSSWRRLRSTQVERDGVDGLAQVVADTGQEQVLGPHGIAHGVALWRRASARASFSRVAVSVRWTMRKAERAWLSQISIVKMMSSPPAR